MPEKANRRKPRVRKTAPTFREVAEAEQAKTIVEVKKSSGLRRFFGFILTPLKPIWRVLKKVLGWLVPRYFVNAWREVKQVTWPGRKETWRLTLAVFIFASVFGFVVYFVDKGLEKLFKELILK